MGLKKMRIGFGYFCLLAAFVIQGGCGNQDEPEAEDDTEDDTENDTENDRSDPGT